MSEWSSRFLKSNETILLGSVASKRHSKRGELCQYHHKHHDPFFCTNHGPPRKRGASAIRRVTLCRKRSSSHPCQNERGLMYYVRAYFPEMKKMKMVLSLSSRASGLQTIGRLLISSRLTPENGQTLDAHCLSSPLREFQVGQAN
ncbi:hypothetical protein PISMIDRAFT_269185 [Pisolithus microcarpus 441]|uniref:Uncharacterized protein n=1 Tax=Pisolithus microcarpus 441 TaxID=765257 RepID=A0A0C9YR04_9AGAM|nr:hypothetical protein BKA83DRAFT_269185 [Pisolithus microcarpus]KIK16274.1 hypothetical protein PISMIDRAFT_269185 [Pisolithus microcarpus 441]